MKLAKWKKVLYVISWVPVILLYTFPLLLVWPFVHMSWGYAFLPVGLIFLGLVVVPVALLKGWQSRHWYKLFWLWGNDEEEYPIWWNNLAGKKGWFIRKFPAFWWYAVRNPVNNFRFIFLDRKPQIETNWNWIDKNGNPEPMESQNMHDHDQVMAYRWAYDGVFAGYRRVWLKEPKAMIGSTMIEREYSEFWLGWKVGSTVPGMGFAMSRRNGKIGN